MKFIADGMLGKLARWLRVMGHDVLYDVDLEDDEIMASSENRIILTRDVEFYKKLKKGGKSAIFIEATDIKGQLSQLNSEGVSLRDTPVGARCPLCNGALEDIEREKIKESVPVGVPEFFVCSECRKIYWEGLHWKNIKETIKDVEKRGKDVQNPTR